MSIYDTINKLVEEITRLNDENAKLRKRIDELSEYPKVVPIYTQPTMIPYHLPYLENPIYKVDITCNK